MTLTQVTGGARIEGLQQIILIIKDSDNAHGAIRWQTGNHFLNTVSKLAVLYAVYSLLNCVSSSNNY